VTINEGLEQVVEWPRDRTPLTCGEVPLLDQVFYWLEISEYPLEREDMVRALENILSTSFPCGGIASSKRSAP
jgi:hypothetical protein